MNAWLETSFGDRIPVHGHCSLGRDPNNTLVLPGHQVSRRHAMIHPQGNEEYWLVDFGSRNGVLCNGRRLIQPVALKDKDRLEIGGNVLVFRQSEREQGTGSNAADTSTDDRTVAALKTADLWLLLADIEKFTPLSQTMPGAELAKLVGKWIVACKEIVEQHEGEINQYLGDGFLAYWPSAAAASVAETLRKLIEMKSDSALRFRLVVHHGTVTVDYALSRGQNSLIGPEVNFVFRMEKIAASLRQDCMLTESAGARLKDFGQVTLLGRYELKGFEGLHGAVAFVPATTSPGRHTEH